MSKERKEVCGICMKELVVGQDCTCSERKVTFYSDCNDFEFDKDGNLTCECGSNKFGLRTHINMGTKHLYNYACSRCGKLIGKESIRKKEDVYGLWDYEEDDE